jgi:hypothetical protein
MTKRAAGRGARLVALALVAGCGRLMVAEYDGFDPESGTTGNRSSGVRQDSEGQPPDNSPEDTGEDPGDFEACSGIVAMPRNIYEPADLVLAIDNTTSMGGEIAQVRANMNRLSQMVGALGLNLRVVLVSCLTEECLAPNSPENRWHTICVDPPLGAACGCPPDGPDADTNLPDFLHVDRRIESMKSLSRITMTHDQWGFMIRDVSAKHVVVISDDNNEWTAQAFIDTLVSLDPRFEGFRFHSIYSYLSKEAACAISSSEPCCAYAAPGGEGTVYRELVARTGGVSGDLCLQNFDPVFDELASAVVESVQLACEWEIPAPPAGMTFDPARVNVALVSAAGEPYYLYYASAPSGCTAVPQGWYYDNPAQPSQIIACPSTCDWLRAQPGAHIEIEFGCESHIY